MHCRKTLDSNFPQTIAMLSSKKILQENNTNDPNSITSLTLTHRALSDVSCLSEFKNLERLDLGFNNLTSLEDLKSCVNLKWLSVVQNKLQSLKGIESLTKLTVLNAGKNKLKSMEEVKYLASMRALILNDNEISSVCKLHQMKELNTLVLSRNPIRSLGESLAKLKSITKLSLSNCQLQTFDSSIKSCVELKELRLAHNEIMTVPSESGHLVKLQNLDMGNNLITNWSNLKVLSSLVNLRNLNLQGNPIAEKENILKKVKKLLPNLHIFNARPIDKIVNEKFDDFRVEADNKLALRGDRKVDHSMRNEKPSKARPMSETMDNHLNIQEKKKKRKDLQKNVVDSSKNVNTPEKKAKKKLKMEDDKLDVIPEDEKKLKQKKQKKNQLPNETDGKGKETDKSRKTPKGDKASIIDSSENPFVDLFTTGVTEVPVETAGRKSDQKSNEAISEVVTFPTKKRKKNRAVDAAALELLQVDEIGLGGPSAWEI